MRFQEKKIPYPVMIKASEGGGGKGIRRVTCEADFEISFRRVQARYFYRKNICSTLDNILLHYF